MNENLQKIDDLTIEQIASICDHTFLKRSEGYKKTAKPGESPVRLREKEYVEFMDKVIFGNIIPYAICVRPEIVERTYDYLDNRVTPYIRVVSVVGFPDGSAYDKSFKKAETKLAIKQGAEEIDMVINNNFLKIGGDEIVYNDISKIVDYAHKHNALVKVILETSELTPEQIITACEISDQACADFVKTSTGFGAYGARAEDLIIMREHFPRGIKMSGGVNKENVKELLKAASGRNDGYIDLDPLKIRIGSSSIIGEGKY